MQRNIFGIYLGGRKEIKYLREGKRIKYLKNIRNQLRETVTIRYLERRGKLNIWGRIKRIKNEG